MGIDLTESGKVLTCVAYLQLWGLTIVPDSDWAALVVYYVMRLLTLRKKKTPTI